MGDKGGPPPDVTRWLHEWGKGRRDAFDHLFALVYDELRRMARARMAQERAGHTLQATALVHEAFERLVQQRVAFTDRAHFFAIAADCMRRILVDHARRKGARKRPPRGGAVSLEDVALVGPDAADTVLAVHEAIEQLERLDPRQAEITTLRYFGGLTVEEIAATLAISESTVKRQWDVAKLWLLRALEAKT
jgi:RNA polymerase sigma factor (TIGR02999 family)